ncbi:hypothetical protein DS742_25400 [Lacrimispora amygdalina]|uniref:Complexin-2 n=1 Tax=Lacrimispora amygdalina TaxID=253257 RepID=A0A3E2N535_9FIRM|nr:hypothetical protein [Clostridium indicum]RFZ76113.1 hypothetical protein DS742_25400 [Clostridium indicum]
MQDKHIKTLEKALLALAKYLPPDEHDVYEEFLDTYRYFYGKWKRQKQSYQTNAEHYKEVSRQWRKDNQDKAKEYRRQYAQRKKEQASGSANDEQSSQSSEK